MFNHHGRFDLGWVHPEAQGADQAAEFIAEERSGTPSGYIEVPKPIRFWETRVVAVSSPRARLRTFGLAARLLPAHDRERWAEEWAGEWHEVRERPLLTRLAFLARLLVRTGPALAWVLRMQKRKEVA
ncbi:hypothetical protein [Streptomyces sp. NPDC090025]|uniref:hypothetical protein n=1 Tax=Streptomyces sp. NPDC090025 TaxID=3365922 RepID=UPI003835CFD4